MTAREYFDRYVIAGVPLEENRRQRISGGGGYFFVSEEARNITGQSINVDGGMYHRNKEYIFHAITT